MDACNRGSVTASAAHGRSDVSLDPAAGQFRMSPVALPTKNRSAADVAPLRAP
jgi:hypothetical protein